MSAMFFLLNVAIRNWPAYIYSLTSFVLTSRFYHTSEANLVPLLIFILWLGYTLLVSLPCFFCAKYLTGHRYLIHNKNSEYDQEIPQSQTADNTVAPRGRAAQPSQDTRKTN